MKSFLQALLLTAVLGPVGALAASPAPGGRVVAGTSALELAATAMAPGTWVDFTAAVTGFDAGALLQTLPGSHINEYADKGVWNPLTREALFIGISHSGGIEKLIRYTDATDAFDLVSTTSLGDPQHSYQHNAIDLTSGDFYHRPYNSRSIRHYDHPDWTSWTPLPQLQAPSIQVAGALEGFPERGGLLFVDGDWGVWWYQISTNQWTLLAETSGGQGTMLPRLPMGPYHNVAVYNPVHHIVLFGGGNGSETLYKIDTAGTLSTETTAPVPVGINASVFTVDPVSGNYLLFGNDEEFWQYDPPIGEWTQLPPNQEPPFFALGADGPALGTVAFPVPTYGVVMFTTWAHANSKVFLYKHAAASTQLFADGFESGDTSAWSLEVP